MLALQPEVITLLHDKKKKTDMALSHPHPHPHSYTCNQHTYNLSMLVAEELFNSSKCNQQFPRLHQPYAFSFTKNMSLSGG